MNKKDLEIILSELNKIYDKYQAKENKILAKANDVSVVFQGETYSSEDDVMGAYEGDAITLTQANKLIEKLETKQSKVFETKYSGVLKILANYINGIREEINQIIAIEAGQKNVEEQIKSIMVAKGCSHAEAVEEVQNDR